MDVNTHCFVDIKVSDFRSFQYASARWFKFMRDVVLSWKRNLIKASRKHFPSCAGQTPFQNIAPFWTNVIALFSPNLGRQEHIAFQLSGTGGIKTHCIFFSELIFCLCCGCDFCQDSHFKCSNSATNTSVLGLPGGDGCNGTWILTTSNSCELWLRTLAALILAALRLLCRTFNTVCFKSADNWGIYLSSTPFHSFFIFSAVRRG